MLLLLLLMLRLMLRLMLMLMLRENLMVLRRRLRRFGVRRAQVEVRRNSTRGQGRPAVGLKSRSG